MLFTAPARAEWTPCARVETESIQSLSYGVLAFCRRGNLNYNMLDLNQAIARHLKLPNLSGINLRGNVSLHFLIDPDAPKASQKTASLIIAELSDNGITLLSALYNVYENKEEQPWGIAFSKPQQGYNGCETLAVSLYNGKAYMSDNPSAISWATRSGRPTIPLTNAGSGQFLLTVNPTGLATYLSCSTNMPLSLAASVPNTLIPTGILVNAVAKLPELAENIDDLTLSMNASGISINFTLNLTLKNETPGFTEQARMRPYERWYSSLVPDNATFASIMDTSVQHGWRNYLGLTLNSIMPSFYDLIGNNLAGHVLTYLTQRHDGSGMIFVAIAKVSNPVEAQRLLAEKLHNYRLSSGLTILRGENRRGGNNEINCFTLTNTVADASTPLLKMETSTFNAIANLLSRITVIETAVSGVDLALVAGPSGAIESVIEDLNSKRPPYLPLHERSRLLTQNFPSDNATSITLFNPIALLRQIITALPGYKSDQLAASIVPGDGAMAWSSTSKGKYTGTLRIAANEVEAIQTVMTSGRAAIQEFLLNMVMNQVLTAPESQK